MKKFLLPAILALLGTGGGIGAAMFLSSSEAPDAAEHGDETEAAVGDCLPPKEGDGHAASADAEAAADGHGEPGGRDFVKLGNQFVVPVVKNDHVEALVILSLSLAVPAGTSSEVYKTEPKLRDAFLGVLFEHANAGHFGPGFTKDESLDILKRGLRDVALTASGGLVEDVLITEIARQAA